MIGRRGLRVGLLCMVTLAGTARAQVIAKAAAPFRGNAVAGRELADSERCVECHGADGQASHHADAVEGKFPRLAGQSPDYLMKQLRDLRGGARKNDFMSIMARSIDDTTAADIVAFFASLPPMHGDGDAAASDATGRALYERGAPARAIPACASCHGERAQGQRINDLHVPRLAGQTGRYLERQLLDWRSGERSNSAGGAMNAAVRGLDDADIQSLARYLSGLGGTPLSPQGLAP